MSLYIDCITTEAMVKMIREIFIYITKIILEDFHRLPTTNSKVQEVEWFPMYDLEEIIILN
jgi:hypothetical protein